MKSLRRRLSLALLLLQATGLATAQDPVPSHLVGVWATAETELRQLVFFDRGSAIYLDSDGKGLVIGGPPPIGFEISATYSASTNTIDYLVIENGKSLGSRIMYYDPSEEAIYMDKAKKSGRFLRRSSAWPYEAIRKMGLGSQKWYSR